jgi:hypothetical protein
MEDNGREERTAERPKAPTPAGRPRSSLSSHIPGMLEFTESISDKIKAAGEGGIFKRHSGAADVVVVSYCSTGEERWETSNFHVHVGRDAKLGQSLQANPTGLFFKPLLCRPFLGSVDLFYCSRARVCARSLLPLSLSLSLSPPPLSGHLRGSIRQ